MKISILSLAVLVLCACNGNRKFDKISWLKQKDLNTYPFRNSMLKDLTQNHKIIGLSYRQTIELLGFPENSKADTINILYYDVLTKYGSDIDPIYTKTLKIFLNRDSLVEGFKIDEWEK